MQLRATLPDSGEVHVWFVELAACTSAVETCYRTLSPDELERASRFRFARLRTDFMLSRGILRALLGRYLAMDPARVRFAYGPRGKPRLSFPISALSFNMAHSGKFAAYAFAGGSDLGVDIEEVRPIPGQENIARRFFSPAECEEWLELDAALRDQAFFHCWTRKEAYIKALGDGLAMPLESFRVSLGPAGWTSLNKWRLYSLAPEAGYAGALAVPECTGRVRILPRLTARDALELAASTA